MFQVCPVSNKWGVVDRPWGHPKVFSKAWPGGGIQRIVLSIGRQTLIQKKMTDVNCDGSFSQNVAPCAILAARLIAEAS